MRADRRGGSTIGSCGETSGGACCGSGGTVSGGPFAASRGDFRSSATLVGGRVTATLGGGWGSATKDLVMGIGGLSGRATGCRGHAIIRPSGVTLVVSRIERRILTISGISIGAIPLGSVG